jgi:hypothetical protein
MCLRVPASPPTDAAAAKTQTSMIVLTDKPSSLKPHVAA